ncbi:CLUMA_CG001190, isoform A [Clunio marinus]|uniref:CLUMA_CG001190, isoform A n=1 Tax=Clunio marinus TaxID=568069 RepID=A0A1J1HJ06_9DIPT|nr:CLUMA_CG001190, isoform A [Clunio marinus]
MAISADALVDVLMTFVEWNVILLVVRIWAGNEYDSAVKTVEQIAHELPEIIKLELMHAHI